jgi:hypothetical protein
MGRPRSHDCRFWSLLVPLVVPVMGLLVVRFGGSIAASVHFGGVIIVVAWCACLCLAVHAVQHGWGNRSRSEDHTPPVPEWRATRARFAKLRSEYSQFECDPLAVLRLSALTDVTVPSTGRFVNTFGEAQALDTDTEPPPAHCARFASAVDQAWRDWHAARDAAERIRLAGITAEERATVERAIKLLTIAHDCDHEAERIAVYAKTRAELAKLERSETLFRRYLPPPAIGER